MRIQFAVYAACSQCTYLFLHGLSTGVYYRSARGVDEVRMLLHISIANIDYNQDVRFAITAFVCLVPLLFVIALFVFDDFISITNIVAQIACQSFSNR